MKKEDMDKLVIDLLRKVEEKKEAIKNNKKKPKWRTNCVWKSEFKNINIQTVTAISELVALAAHIDSLIKGVELGAKLLDVELEEDDKEMHGYPAFDWIEDLKTRTRMLLVAKQEEELADLDKRVNKLVTPEQRRAMELEALKDLLN